MILEILAWSFLGVMALAFLALSIKEFTIRRMSESFDLGMKMALLRQQLSDDQMDAILRDAGIDPDQLIGGNQ